jgi:hypothetical protein
MWGGGVGAGCESAKTEGMGWEARGPKGGGAREAESASVPVGTCYASYRYRYLT